MTDRRHTSLFTTVAALAFASLAHADTTTQPTLPQAKPFADFLSAVKTGDADKFRDVQSKSVRESNQPWPKKLQDAKRTLAHRYGDYDLSLFVYAFVGTDSQGDLTIKYGDKLPMTMKVVKEGEEWKLASH